MPPFVELQHETNLFHLLYRRLFTGPLFSKTRTAETKAVTLADLAALPKHTQLLLAHFLERNSPNLLLLDDDTDVCKLLSSGWLTSLLPSPPGFVSFKIKPQLWRQMRSLSPKFFTDQLLSELESYRQRKSAAYPWVW